jgi:hypothetical protein
VRKQEHEEQADAGGIVGGRLEAAAAASASFGSWLKERVVGGASSGERVDRPVLGAARLLACLFADGMGPMHRCLGCNVSTGLSVHLCVWVHVCPVNVSMRWSEAGKMGVSAHLSVWLYVCPVCVCVCVRVLV